MVTRRLYFKKKMTLNGHFSRPAETDPYALSLTITKQLDSLELKSEDLSRMKQLVKVLFVFSYEKLIQFIAGGGHL